MHDICSNPLFGITLTLLTYLAGVGIQKKVKSPLANPLFIAMLLSTAVLRILGISVQDYMNGGDYLVMLITPATAVLGLSVYRQRKILKQEFFPILIGCTVGSLCSMGSVALLCHWFRMDSQIVGSLLPKSVTTAIALDLSEQLGGMPSVTLLAVMVCGILGAIINPLLAKAFHITDAVAVGVGMGTASHAVGTSKAIEMGEVEGAVSGVSIGVAGIAAVIISLFL